MLGGRVPGDEVGEARIVAEHLDVLGGTAPAECTGIRKRLAEVVLAPLKRTPARPN